MFRSDLKRRLEAIFQFEKTTLQAYDDNFEQDTLFIEIETGRSRINGTNGMKATARVVGHLVVFSEENKLTFGYFIKAIEAASAELKRPFFFYDIDVDRPDSQARKINIHERRCSFVFFYDAQYDPDQGTFAGVNLNINFEG